MLRLWEQLKTIQHFTIHAHSQFGAGWDRSGKGTVSPVLNSPTILTFYEKGTWEETISFTNALRWTFDQQQITLEHLHLGPDHPTLLCHLVPTKNHTLISQEPHLCKQDTYIAKLSWDPNHIHLSWRITGPKKNEEITCLYK